MICNTLSWLHNIGPNIGWLPVIAIVVYVGLLCWTAACGNLESSVLYVPDATVMFGLILFGTWSNEFQRTLYGCNFDPGMCGYSHRHISIFGCG